MWICFLWRGSFLCRPSAELFDHQRSEAWGQRRVRRNRFHILHRSRHLRFKVQTFTQNMIRTQNIFWGSEDLGLLSLALIFSVSVCESWPRWISYHNRKYWTIPKCGRVSVTSWGCSPSSVETSSALHCSASSSPHEGDCNTNWRKTLKTVKSHCR